MVVGAAGDQQAEALGEAQQGHGLLRGVLGVDRLDAAEAERLERAQAGLQSGVVGFPRERVRDDGDAAGLADHADALFRIEAVAVDIGGAALGEILVKRLIHGRDIIAVDQRLRDMGASDNVLAGAGLDLGPVQFQAQLVELLEDLLVAPGAAFEHAPEALLHQRVVRVQPVAENVQRAGAFIDGGADFNAGDAGHAARAAGGQKILNAVHRIVVGQGHRAQAGLPPEFNQAFGRLGAVRVRGVDVQIDHDWVCTSYVLRPRSSVTPAKKAAIAVSYCAVWAKAFFIRARRVAKPSVPPLADSSASSAP